MRWAIDFEGVLADTGQASIDHSDKLTEEDFEQWDWETPGGYDEFITTSHNVLQNHLEDIPPVEDNLAEKVARIRDEVDELHLVTARVGCDEQIKKWLDMHGIELDGYHFVDEQKRKKEFERPPSWDFGYQVFIDDNPNMVGEVLGLYLRDRPLNQHIDTRRDDHTTRINSLDDIELPVSR